MYIRTQAEALEVLAGILDLPERRDRIVRTTVGIMKCLDPEARRFMADCLALLVQGVEGLRRQRHEAAEAAQEYLPLVIVNPEEDRKYETVASALDVRRLAGVILQIFPGLLSPEETWRASRALWRDEEAVRERVAQAIRSRGRGPERRKALEGLQSLIRAYQPPWNDRAVELRSACRDILEAAGVPDPEGESRILFEVLATADDWAEKVLRLMEEDPPGAILEVLQTHNLMEAVRSAQEAADLQSLCQAV